MWRSLGLKTAFLGSSIRIARAATVKPNAVCARDCLKTSEELMIVARLGLVCARVTLTPALSQGEREACGADFRSPLPQGEG